MDKNILEQKIELVVDKLLNLGGADYEQDKKMSHMSSDIFSLQIYKKKSKTMQNNRRSFWPQVICARVIAQNVG